MESEIAAQVTQPEVRSAWNRVTPLSKYLAMVLFVVLPFLGGFVGYKFALKEAVSVTPVSQLSEVPSENEPIPTPPAEVLATYRNEGFDFEFRYPEDLSLEETPLSSGEGVSTVVDLEGRDGLKVKFYAGPTLSKGPGPGTNADRWEPISVKIQGQDAEAIMYYYEKNNTAGETEHIEVHIPGLAAGNYFLAFIPTSRRDELLPVVIEIVESLKYLP